MSNKWGDVDFKELEKLLATYKSMDKAFVDRCMIKILKETAAKLLAKVIARTLPGVYPSSSGKKGGTLRRGWTAKTHSEAESGKGKGNKSIQHTRNHVEKLGVKKSSGIYEIEIINPVEYSLYVEKGHRIKDKDGEVIGFVKGKFMLLKSELEMRAELPKLATRLMKKMIREKLDGK